MLSLKNLSISFSNLEERICEQCSFITFAGLPESETDNFEYVNFAEKAQGDEVVYAQDRWCGLYCFNADADPSDSNFSLGCGMHLSSLKDLFKPQPQILISRRR